MARRRLGAGSAAGRRHRPSSSSGASYIAKQVCSCIFVAGRAEGPCRAEFKPQIDPFAVTVGAAQVTADLGPVTAEADYDPAYGCVLVR